MTLPESLTEDEDKNIGAEENGNDSRQSHSLLNKPSSYEIYVRADLLSAKFEDTPSAVQLTSLGDPFTTKMQLPSEMCSSIENLYLKFRAANENIVREADYLAAEILEEAVQKAAQVGQLPFVTLATHTSIFSDIEVNLPGEAKKAYFEINSKKSGFKGIVVVQPHHMKHCRQLTVAM